LPSDIPGAHSRNSSSCFAPTRSSSSSMSYTCHAREPIRNLTARPFRTTPARFRSAILTSRARWITRQAAPVGGCVITYTANGTQRVAVANQLYIDPLANGSRHREDRNPGPADALASRRHMTSIAASRSASRQPSNESTLIIDSRIKCLARPCSSDFRCQEISA